MDDNFVHWDDLDLDYILGSDYTDNDDDLKEFDDGGDDCLKENSQNKNSRADDCVSSTTKRQKMDQENNAKKGGVYQCPDCDKQFNSVSGFRGHMSKKHGKNNLKAHKHKIRKSVDEEKETSLEDKMSTFLHQNNFRQFLIIAMSLALSSIIADPMNNLPKSCHGKQIIDIANVLKIQENMPSYENILSIIFDNLHSVFLSVRYGINLERDRELVLMKFHRFRANKTVVEKLLHLIQSVTSDLQINFRVLQLFVQDWIGRIFENLLQQQIQMFKVESEQKAKELSDDDQNVLFYVCGFLIHSLTKKYSRLKSSLSSLLLKTVGQLIRVNDQNSFVRSYSKWNTACDRGGLKMPSDDMFLLVREFEMILKQHVNIDQLAASSLLKDQLKEMIMESFMVKHYWGKIVKHEESETLVFKVLEDMINTFLSVRGHAIAKSIRRKLQKQTRVEHKSHRQCLKEKSTNSLNKK